SGDRSRGCDHDRVLHRAGLSGLAYDVRTRPLLLPDSDIDTFDAARLLIDDRVDGEGRLARLAVADDERSLAASDRHHRIDRLVAGLHRLAHRLAVDDAGCDALDRRVARGVDGAFAVDRIAERVHDASEQPLADGHFEDAAGRLDRVAFADVLVLAEHDRADRVLLEVQREPDAAAGEFQHFAVLGVGKTVDAHDTVRDGHDRTDVALFGGALELLDARLDEIADFRCLDGHCHSPQ